jgi:hypothetical protein
MDKVFAINVISQFFPQFADKHINDFQFRLITTASADCQGKHALSV